MLKKLVHLLVLFILCYPIRVSSQSVDDYRSLTTGNWTSSGTWQRWDGSSWQNDPSIPTRGDGEITIRDGHIVTVNSGTDVDGLTVDFGATVVIAERLRVYDGPGIDLQMNGTVQQDGHKLVLLTGTTNVFSSTSVTNLLSDNFRAHGNSLTTFESGALLNISGSGGVNFRDSATITFDAGSTITNDNLFKVDLSATVNISGSFIHSGIFVLLDSGQLNFLDGSNLEYALNGSAFPVAARTSFAAGSKVEVTGVTTTVPTDLNHVFSDFEWNATSQTADIDLNAAPISFGGDFTVTSTGSGTDALVWIDAGSTDMLVAGDFIQTGGDFEFTRSSGSGTLFADNVDISGGTLDLNSGSGAPTLEISGDLTVGGLLTESGSNRAIVLLSGSSQQSIAAPSGITQNVDIEVDNAAGALLASEFSAPANLTITSGDFDFGAYDVSVGGDLSVQGSISNSETVSFVGLSDQSISGAGELTFKDLIADLSGNTLGFSTDIRILSSGVNRSGSTIDVNGNAFTFVHTATFLNSGTLSGTISMERLYSQTTDGWRMMAAPVSGVSYSDLNSTFETQGATWASTTLGDANLEKMDFILQDWVPLNGVDASFTLTDGYIFYMFTEDEFGASVLPATWSVTGVPGSTNSKSLTWNTSTTDSYNFVGNPTSTNLDWDAVVPASTNLSTSYATWDPFLTTEGGLTGYKYYNSASGIGLAGRYIPPFTAFMAQPTASGGTIQFPVSEAANTASANHFGKGSTSEYNEREISSHIQLQIEGQGLAEVETYLVFDERASDSEDDLDVFRMKPFSSDYVTINLLSDDRLLAFDGRNMDADVVRFNFEIVGSTPGLYQISWPVFHNIPDTWSVYFIDHRDGGAVDMRLETRFTVQLLSASSGSMTDKVVTASFSEASRYSIVVDRTVGTNASEYFAIGSAVTLNQNFPNPFSGSTTFRFSVPQSTNVSLELFDLLGRKIETVHSGHVDSGWHSIRWNTSRLASGTYVARLKTQFGIQTRMLVKAK